MLIASLALLLAALFITSCSAEEPTGTVVVRYNAGEGTFTANTYTVTDTYSLSELPKDREGNYLLPLVDPSDARRGKENAFLASRSGYFLVGWYANLGTAEEPEYKKWDFSSDVYKLDKDTVGNGTVVLDVHAMWLPEFSYEFYDLNSGALLKSHKVDPVYVKSLKLPEWDEETGKLDMHDFPEVEGRTYRALYLDPHGTEPYEGEWIFHTGVIDYESIASSGSAMKLYVDTYDSITYNVYKAEHLLDAADPAATYNIMCELDFAEDGWSDKFMDGHFTGKILGNGHKLKNITLYQSSTSKTDAGLFGVVKSGAVFEDVIFENVNFFIEAGSRMVGASFGLFAGVLEEGVELTGVSINGKITVTPSPYITSSTVLGLFCGTGNPGDIDISGIRCVALEPESDYDTGLSLRIDGNTVRITVIPAKED